MIDEEQLEPSDKIEESGGRTEYFEQPTERSGEQSPAPVEEDPELEDYWTLTSDVLVIHHMKPRLKLFTPSDENCPIPLRYLDVRRLTTTNLESAHETFIEDFWYDEPLSDRKLSGWWIGKTRINLLRPLLEPGWEWQGSRLTRKMETSRPPHIHVEEWAKAPKRLEESGNRSGTK